MHHTRNNNIWHKRLPGKLNTIVRSLIQNKTKQNPGNVDIYKPKSPFFVGASCTDKVMSFWLAGRMGLSDSACFRFISRLN